MTELSVLVPYKPDQGPRDEIFRWISAFYRKYMPFAEICLGHSKSQLFSRAQAINDAASKAKTDCFLIADNDLIYDPDQILKAKAMLAGHPWIIPYSKVHNIQEDSTKKLLRTEPVWPLGRPVRTVVRAQGTHGGLTLIPRKHFEAVNGFDERFVGWGGEDDAFAYSVDTICGRHRRLEAEIYHLWHPNDKTGGNPNYQNNFELCMRYFRARGHVGAMKQLISSRSRTGRDGGT